MNRAQDDETRDELSYLRTEVKRLRAALNRRSPDLEGLLEQRGFTIYKKEPTDDLLVPADERLAGYYRMLHKYSFRLFLRDVIRHSKGFTLEDVSRYATPPVTREYIDYLLSIGLIRGTAPAYELARDPVTSFGATLEWYIAEVLRREFRSEALWGVKFKRPKVGGDYDVIARFDCSLLYVEVKSSPPKQVYDSEISAFLDRVSDLAPAIAVFLMDTELRMKDKLVPMFDRELGRRCKKPPPVRRMEQELFQFRDRIFIVNAKGGLVRNLEKAMQWYYQKAAGIL